MSTNSEVFAQSNAEQAQQKQNNKYEVPVELVSLPSKGVLYSTAHPLHAAENVEIRSMTAREEDLITSAALIKQGTTIPRLINACLINKSVDVNSLLLGDRDAILIGIRATSYGTSYKSNIECGSCSTNYEHEFSLNNLSIKPLGAEPVGPSVNMFEFTLPLSKQKVRFKLFTVNDMNNLEKSEENKRKLKLATETRITSQLQSSIHSINGEEDGAKLAPIIMNMRAGDSRALRHYMRDIQPGINTAQEVHCPSCSATESIDIPFGPSFFLG